MRAEAILSQNGMVYLQIFLDSVEALVFWEGGKYTGEELKDVKNILEKETGKRWALLSERKLADGAVRFEFREVRGS